MLRRIWMPLLLLCLIPLADVHGATAASISTLLSDVPSALALGIFGMTFLGIVFEPYEKSVIALSGGLLMVIFRILTPEQAIGAIEFDTILLLMGMMMLVHMAAKSGILAWLNVRIANFTGGNPLSIFLLFSLLTAGFSAFLDNVTTVILIVPITIELLRGMGKDPKIYVISEILFSNIGGALTLVGDPPNIIIGGATGLSFLQFIRNLWIPIGITTVVVLGVLLIQHRKKFKSIADDLVELHLAHILIEKIRHKFIKRTLHRDFVMKVVTVLGMTVLGFLLQEYLELPSFIIALSGAVVMGLIAPKRINIHDAFASVEWSTLFFFAGLFVLVGGLEQAGFLHVLSQWVIETTDNPLYLLLLILWVSGFVSMIIDNIPFVTVMVPVIFGIQDHVPLADPNLLWWALSLGACLGGNGTLIGASANVISADIAAKEDLRISFLDYMKVAFPLTILSLVICSGYLYFRLNAA